MSEETGICFICLHTDKYLKVVNTELSDFHEELCGFVVMDNPQYCSRCEHILRNAYKFRVKCVMAIDILKRWKRNKGVDKKSITDLCTLLPESLDVWMLDNPQIFSSTDEETTPAHSDMMVEPLRIQPEQRSEPDTAEDITKSQELLENSLIKDIKLETNETETCLTDDSSVIHLKDRLIIKEEDATDSSEEFLFQNNDNIENENDDESDFANNDTCGNIDSENVVESDLENENNETHGKIENENFVERDFENKNNETRGNTENDVESELENENNDAHGNIENVVVIVVSELENENNEMRGNIENENVVGSDLENENNEPCGNIDNESHLDNENNETCGNIENESDFENKNNETQSYVVTDILNDHIISNNGEDKITYLKNNDKSNIENENNDKQSDAVNDILNDFIISDNGKDNNKSNLRNEKKNSKNYAVNDILKDFSISDNDDDDKEIINLQDDGKSNMENKNDDRKNLENENNEKQNNVVNDILNDHRKNLENENIKKHNDEVKYILNGHRRNLENENNKKQNDVLNDILNDHTRNLENENNKKQNDVVNYILNDHRRNLENENNKKQNDVVNDILNDFSISDDDNDKLLYLKNTLHEYKQYRNKNTRKRCLENDNQSKTVKLTEKNIIVVKKEDYYSKKSVPKKNKDSKKNVRKKTVAKKIVDKDSAKRIKLKPCKAAEKTNEVSKTMDLNARKGRKNKKYPFTKERLQEELKSKFASCGELKAADGTVIDKEFVLGCLEDKVTEFCMRQLYKSLYRRSRFMPRALRLFKSIQNKYRNDHEYDSVFDIEYLNTKEKMIEEFEKRVTYESYVTAEFKCEVCYQGFKHEKKLEYHRKCSHDVTAGEMICTICKVRERTMYKLSRHMSTHEAVYRCKLCPLVTYYKMSMKNHYEQHNGVIYTCKQCKAVFKSRSTYTTHVLTRHARSHACACCGRAFATSLGLRVHRTRDHKNEAPLAMSVKCDECSLFFVSEEAREKHAQYTHKTVIQGIRPYVKRRPTVIRKHPTITCRECGASGSFGWLKLHFRMEHPTLDLDLIYADKKAHLCHICGKGFGMLITLQRHLNTHTGLRPYACDLCPKRWPSSVALRMHRLRHFPPTLECKECGQKFISTSNLYNHMQRHIGKRRHKCNICGKTFLHSYSVREHIQGVHFKVRRKRGKNTPRGKSTTSSGEETSD